MSEPEVEHLFPDDDFDQAGRTALCGHHEPNFTRRGRPCEPWTICTACDEAAEERMREQLAANPVRLSYAALRRHEQRILEAAGFRPTPGEASWMAPESAAARALVESVKGPT